MDFIQPTPPLLVTLIKPTLIKKQGVENGGPGKHSLHNITYTFWLPSSLKTGYHDNPTEVPFSFPFSPSHCNPSK